MIAIFCLYISSLEKKKTKKIKKEKVFCKAHSKIFWFVHLPVEKNCVSIVVIPDEISM